MKNYTLRLLFWILFGTGCLPIQAQVGPSCRPVNLAVASDDSATVVVENLVINAAAIVPFHFEILNPFGGFIASLYVTDPASSVRIPACSYLGRQLTFNARNNFGHCSNTITFKEYPYAIIRGHATTVYCTDSLLFGGVVGDGPEAFLPCSPAPQVSYVADWFVTFPCEENQDTAKIIYREYAATSKNGNRATGFDTIVVLRLPEITVENTYCVERDTTYCDQPEEPFGPYMLIESPETGQCDTLWFLNPDSSARSFEAKCGLLVSVDTTEFPVECGGLTKYVVDIKQTCFSTPEEQTCTIPTAIENDLENLGPGYWSCTFWRMDLDTAGPVVLCGEDTLIVPAGVHDCTAHFTLPAVTAEDLCSEVIMVKAIVEGQGTVAFEKSGDFWVSSQSVKLPFSPEPHRVIYEAFDQCHNVGRDTCYFLVEDLAAPLAVANKKLHVTLSGKKTWVDADNFNENSVDNCELAIILARRSDWKEACIDLCDSLTYVANTPDGPIWRSELAGDEIDNPVAAHYRKTLEWLEIDGGVCNELLAAGWYYDLMKYATVICEAAMTETQFDQAVVPYINPEVDFIQAQQLGGGWSDQVPFTCDDVCGLVTVELLVMDYWCNWNTSWTKVLVEDKTPVEIAKEVTQELEISCKIFGEERYTYDGSPISIRGLVEAAAEGDPGALTEIDGIFGTYRKAWKNHLGEIVDSAGNVLDCDIPFVDSMCICADSVTTLEIWDPHLGWIIKDTTIRYCYYEVLRDTFRHGAVAVNCTENTHCTQTLWYSLDHCGQGVIYRKWKIWKECVNADTLLPMQTPDTTFRLQSIWVGNTCPLDKGMFLLPGDTVLQACEIVYDPDGSGNVGGGLHPDSIGKPIFLFDDDCRQVGIAYTDKVLEAVDTSECDVVMRTWCFADWCNVKQPVSNDWIQKNTLFKHVQFIHVCRNLCSLDCTNLRDTSINCFDIPADVTDLYAFFNTPEVVSADTHIVCEVTLENQIVIDTNSCGFGSITSHWYLIDMCGTLVDSCDETITLLSDTVTVREGRSYFGDAEPFNCSDFMNLDPVEVTGACPKLGLFTVTNDSPYPGNDASGDYEVGVHYIHYKIASACLDTIYLTDTITVIDDVNPTVSAFSDPCVNLMEWETDFNSDPLHPNIRIQLAVDSNDNCAVDTVLLISLDSTIFPNPIDPMMRDSTLYTYQWQSKDTFGNLSTPAISTLLVSDFCEEGPNFIHDAGPAMVEIGDKAQRLMSFDHSDDDERFLKNGVSGYGANTTEGFQLFQNRPNPFRQATTIGFQLPEQTSAVISVFDLTGRKIREIKGDYSKGYHEIELLQTAFHTTGIYYYRFDSDRYTAMKKMILIE